MGHRLRLFFTTDVHASEVCYLKFLNAAQFYKAQVLILGGDITGKMVVPIIKQGEHGYMAELHGSLQVVQQDSLQKLVQTIRNSGYYPFVLDAEEFERLREDRSRVDALFKQLMVDTVRRWVRLAEERLKDKGVKVYISPGNDDIFEIDEVLSSSDFVINPEEKVVELDGYEMITWGFVNPTPWRSPRELPEEELYRRIEAMASQVRDMRRCIYNLHCPPYDTPLDVAVRLDEQLRPVIRGGEPEMVHVGSLAVRRSIEQHQPLLGLHGHIHESRGACKIGRTLCLNPGSEYGEGLLRGALVELEENKVRFYLLTQG
ncbi:MAG: metallophosphoesterase [Nitrososphaerota archaeon]